MLIKNFSFNIFFKKKVLVSINQNSDDRYCHTKI